MDLKAFLSSRYDSKEFVRFLQERFRLQVNIGDYTDEGLNESERRHIQGYRYLGQIELDDGKELGFFEFLSTSTLIENKRVGFNSILKKLADEYLLDGAIASFYHPQSSAWRLSFVGFEYEEGKTKATSLRRYTYVLGEGIPIKTAYMQLKKLQYPKFEEIKEIFSVERVTKEFYEKYRGLFERIVATIEANGQANLFEKEANIHLFAKKLLGRIIFLYFLQKKGWLGVSKDGKWGEGKKDFLSYFLQKAMREGKNYYQDYLQVIFFEALSKKRANDYFPLLDCKVPFLNGGLFEKDRFDALDIYLDNELFQKVFHTFNEYNFTVIEDSPDDKEIAVDPEMLGRVFENLLEENYRKGKGAFYTPREIVHYMCQQTIIDVLSNEFDKKYIEKLVVYKETDNDYIKKHAGKIEKRLLSLKILDPAIGSGAFPMGLLHEIVATLEALDKTMSEEERAALKREVIENCIYGIDIDPSAVEIAKLRFWLSLVVDEEHPTPLPNLYYKIMVGNSLFESLYGYDPLVKRRDSLLDETYEEIEKIQPLLHRFFNTNDNSQKVKLKQEIEEKIDAILDKKLQEQEEIIQSQLQNVNVFNGHTKEQQKQIEKARQTQALIRSIKQRPTTELFFYKIYFGEVFHNGGFDIVIGNPPYIRQEKIKELKPRLEEERFYNPLTQKMEHYECLSGTADIYIYFFEKGFRLLSQRGVLSYITSNKYTRAKYGAKFREFLLKNASIKEYIDFNGVRVFESATVDTAILTFGKKDEESKTLLYCDVKEDYKKEQDLYEYIKKNGSPYSQEALSKEVFTFATQKELEIKRRIEEVGVPLKEWDININYGIKTGFNEAFIIDGETKERLIKEDPKSAEIIKPILRGKDIGRYTYAFRDKWIIATFPSKHIDIDEYPAVKRWLEQFLPKLKQTGETYIDEKGQKQKTRKKTGNKWFETQDQIAYWKEFEREKIIYSEIVQSPQFHYDIESFYIEATAFIMTGENLKYLIALLNSTPVAMFFKTFYMGTELGKKGYRYKKAFIEKLPIPKLLSEQQKPFKRLVDIIIDLKKQQDPKAKFFEDVIDVMVYELYFQEELKKNGLCILDIVTRDLQTTSDATKLFEKWSNRKHQVKYSLDYINTLDIVKTIKGGL